MTLLRRLNDTGIQRLTLFLDSLKSSTPQVRPTEILTDPVTSQELESRVDVEERVFPSRVEAAKYLTDKLDAAERKDVERDRGFWAGRSLFYVGQLGPARKAA